MKKIFSLMLALLLAATVAMQAGEIVTPSPRPLQIDSKDVVLYYHADEGNKGLMGQRPSKPIFAHIGVITNKSTGDSDWKYAPKWGDNSEKYELEYEDTDLWSLAIGDIRTYFGITDQSETVKKIAIVFRDENATKEGKTESGGDIFVDVYGAGAQMDFTHDATSTYLLGTTTVNFTVSTTVAGNISLDVNGTVFKSATNATTLNGTYTFNAPGSYVVTAKAVCGSETLTKTIEFVYPTAAVAKNYPGGVPQQGAVKNADGTVTFCLAAPLKSNCTIVGSWDDYQIKAANQMFYHDYNGNRYFWITISGLKDGIYYPYYYLVDGTIAVGDPYAHLVLDPYNDQWLPSDVFPGRPRYPSAKVKNTVLAVYRSDLDDYNWRVKNFQIPDHKNLVIYEMLFRDFTGTEGKANNNGTIAKAIEKLPYLKALGVNAIELMPIMEFNGNNSWGYNTNFYMAPDKAYGSPAEYKQFIDLCHQNGMAVILDIVYNQSEGLHPWYQLYPIESNPFYNKVAPHDYSVLNDWKQDNPLVMQQWKDAITYWMTAYKVDGFRFDLVKGLGDNNSYGGNTEKYNSSRVRRMKELHAAIKAVNPNGIHINENLAGSQEENEMAADGQLNWHQISWNSCQYAMGWPEENNGTKLNGFLSTDTGRTWGSTISYAESHDEERMGFKQIQYGHSSIKTNLTARCQRLGSMAAIMLLTPGPKMIWQFGELGNEETTKNTDGGNNTSPKKVYWSHVDDPDRAGLLANYTALCHLRQDNPSLFSQSATFQRPSWSTDMSTARTMRLSDGQREVVAFINPSPTNSLTITVNAQMLTASNSQLITASKGFTPQITGNGTSVTVTVPANCFAVYATKNVVGVESVDADVVAQAARVVVSDGTISIEGAYTNATVYNLSGIAVAALQGADAASVAPGVYIVKVDGVSTKVVVR